MTSEALKARQDWAVKSCQEIAEKWGDNARLVRGTSGVLEVERGGEKRDPRNGGLESPQD